MGMDVFGKSGNYFQRSVWGWRPIADYILERWPEYGVNVSWHTNDGEGLDAELSNQLAGRLRLEISSGAAAAYVIQRDAMLAAMPDQTCRQCLGTGIRTDAVGVRDGWPDKTAEAGPRAGQKGSCNGCLGKGSVRPIDTVYSLEVDDLQQFADFLAQSDGFEIC